MRVALLVLLLSGCAAAPYWTPANREAVLNPRVLEVEVLPAKCLAHSTWACYVPEEFTIYISRQVPPLPGLRECAEAHERKHAAGWTHETGRKVFAVDCGDGTLWQWPIR